MNSTVLVRALWQSVVSAIIAAIIYIVIYAITSKGSFFLQGTLLVAGITFVIAFLLNLFFSVVFAKR